MKYKQLSIIIVLWMASFFSLGSEPIIIGQTITIDSKVLMKPASLKIRLPSSYQTLKNKRYPVFLSLGSFSSTAVTIDTLSHNQEYPMPDTILVSLTTETIVNFIQRGSKSEDFINFFETDVIPYIDKHYRSQPFRILASSERFGQVTLYSLMQKTELFQAYFAISSWIKDDSGLVNEFETFLKSDKDISAFLWLSSGGEARVAPNYHKLISLLQQHAPKNLKWKSAQFNQNTNMSQGLISLPNAIESLFADLVLTPDSPIVSKGARSIKNYYKQLSDDKYGYAISSEIAIRDLGYTMLNEEKVKKAIEIFEINIKDYPNSPHVYRALATALTIDNNLVAALPLQETAYELAVKQKSEYESYYKQLLNDIKNQLSNK
jgi:predicted alpha/beta superfamily hydrolase